MDRATPVAQRFGVPAWVAHTIVAAAYGALTVAPAATEGPTPCGKDAGSRPYWMGVDQYDLCPCVRPKGHDGPCGCRDHDKPADAVPAPAAPEGEPEDEPDDWACQQVGYHLRTGRHVKGECRGEQEDEQR